MANHKSAKKRAKQSQVRRLRNRSVKTTLKNLEKKVRAAKEDNSENKDEIMRKTQSAIQKAAKKGVLHKKTASRKISRLFKFMNT
ncbi:30S ribosomal protein S20 [Desulfobacula sp.]|uniref:30S ribosomal protein S20 n=1 Tax=Desulfobacula sp. TaxID=2593537 RepID=UPI0026353259|nr:30S ribosomal protein S20 [Desulfobacula sp.]